MYVLFLFVMLNTISQVSFLVDLLSSNAILINERRLVSVVNKSVF